MEPLGSPINPKPKIQDGDLRGFQAPNPKRTCRELNFFQRAAATSGSTGSGGGALLVIVA